MFDTKEYIIDKAYELFMNNSYEGVSISDISKAIGLTKGALYHHFENKEAIFKSVIDKYLIINVSSTYSDEITLFDFLNLSLNDIKKVVKSIIGEELQYRPINYFALLVDAMRHYPGFIDNHMDLFQSEVDKIKMVMDNSIKRGEIRSDINTDILALNYFSLTTGIATNIMQNNSPQKAIELLEKQMFEMYKLMKL